jgi:hypothetical protein
MPDRRRITDVEGLRTVLVNYRDAQRGRGEPLCFDIIWPDLIIDALQLVTPDEIEIALLTAGKDPVFAGWIANALSICELTADPREEGFRDAR